jgi:hypothetical protein
LKTEAGLKGFFTKDGRFIIVNKKMIRYKKNPDFVPKTANQRKIQMGY